MPVVLYYLVQTVNEKIDESMSAAVVDAIAAADGVEPTDLEPLYEAVDPEALDDLFRTSPGSVTFEFNGYRVTVTSAGDVELRSLTAP